MMTRSTVRIPTKPKLSPPPMPIESVRGALPAFEMCPGLLEIRIYAAAWHCSHGIRPWVAFRLAWSQRVRPAQKYPRLRRGVRVDSGGGSGGWFAVTLRQVGCRKLILDRKIDSEMEKDAPLSVRTSRTGRHEVRPVTLTTSRASATARPPAQLRDRARVGETRRCLIFWAG